MLGSGELAGYHVADPEMEAGVVKALEVLADPAAFAAPSIASGAAAPATPWRIGIRHPLQADKVATVVSVRDGAIATSGAYERGEHVRDPFTGKSPAGVLSITIVGPSLTYADAYATAAFAMGPTGLAWVARLAGYAGCAITVDPDGSNGRLTWTPGFERCFADRR